MSRCVHSPSGDRDMTRNHWIDLGPGLVVGIAIVVSTWVTMRAAELGWLVLAGPLGLALGMVSADMLRARLKGKSARPSAAALLMGSTFLLAGLIAMLRDPGLVATLIPTTGSVAWVTIFLLRPEGRRTACNQI